MDDRLRADDVTTTICRWCNLNLPMPPLYIVTVVVVVVVVVDGDFDSFFSAQSVCIMFITISMHANADAIITWHYSTQCFTYPLSSTFHRTTLLDCYYFFSNQPVVRPIYSILFLHRMVCNVTHSPTTPIR